jgi:hypothetical protein
MAGGLSAAVLEGSQTQLALMVLVKGFSSTSWNLSPLPYMLSG